MNRRDALGQLAGLALLGCHGPPPRVASPARPKLHLTPIVDLVSAVDLVWLLQIFPRDLLRASILGPAVETLDVRPLAARFAERYGGVALDTASEVVVAGYSQATLALARTAVNAARAERAFATRWGDLESRVVDQDVVRFWGTVQGEREQVALFGDEGLGVEHGHFGPLRPAIYFAEGKLKHSQPALHAEPLSSAALRLGEGLVRAFAPGPFKGEWAAGLGGLLGGATAAAVSLRAATRPSGDAGALCHLVLTGAWDGQADRAAQYLAATYDRWAQEPLGLLLGFHEPLSAPQSKGDAEALEIEVWLDPNRAARGIRAMTGANLAEILGF